MIDSRNVLLASTDLKQDLFLGSNFKWYSRRGNPTNEKVFSYVLQHELAKVFHIRSDEPVMLKAEIGTYLGLQTSRFDDKLDGSFRFEYSFKKKDFINPLDILRITFLNYIFNCGNPKNAFIFNRQKKIMLKRSYSDVLICNSKNEYLKSYLYRMMVNSISAESFELELNKSIVLCDDLLKEKIKNLINYFEPETSVSSQLLSVYSPTYLDKTRTDLLNSYYILKK